jgi:anion transporter
VNQIFKIAAAFLLFFLFILLPPFAGLSSQGQRVIAVVLLAIVLWATEALHVGVTSILILILLGVTKSVPSIGDLFHGFLSPILYFLVGVMAMGGAIVKSGLAQRAAKIFLRGARGSGKRLFVHCLCSLPPMALILPSAITRNAILLPAYQKMFDGLKLNREDGLVKSIVLTLGLLNPFASSAFMTGGLAPMTTSTLLGGFSWWRWFFLMSVPYYALLIVGGVWTYWVNPSPHRSFDHGELEKLPPLTREEIRVIIILVTTSVLWFTDFWHGWHPAIPALIAAVLLTSPRIGILSWKELEQTIPWSIFFVLGASLSLAQALIFTGAAAWFAKTLAHSIIQFQGFAQAVILMVIVMVTIVHLGIANMSACIALLIPITTSLAHSVAMSPIVFGLIVGIVVDAVILYPVQTATNLLAYETGLIGGKDVLKIGLGLFVLTALVILYVALPWWSLLGVPLILK